MAAMRRQGPRPGSKTIYDRILIGVPPALAHLSIAEIVAGCPLTENQINYRIQKLRRQRREEERDAQAAAVSG